MGLAGPAAAQNAALRGHCSPSGRRFASVYEKVAPAVVVIEVKLLTFPLMDCRRAGVLPAEARRCSAFQTNQGSGFIVSADGYILTNDHVVGDAPVDGITVRLKDGRKFPASLVWDDKSDLAIKIELAIFLWSNSATVIRRRSANSPLRSERRLSCPYTFTVGVISAKRRNNLTNSRSYEEYIQTDASINPGNSGGPLCDIDGR